MRYRAKATTYTLIWIGLGVQNTKGEKQTNWTLGAYACHTFPLHRTLDVCFLNNIFSHFLVSGSYTWLSSRLTVFLQHCNFQFSNLISTNALVDIKFENANVGANRFWSYSSQKTKTKKLITKTLKLFCHCHFYSFSPLLSSLSRVCNSKCVLLIC